MQDIVDVISHKIKLEPCGNYYNGNCPFSESKRFTLAVSPIRQIFYCFHCKKGGNTDEFNKTH